jgi:hypothetical protein
VHVSVIVLVRELDYLELVYCLTYDCIGHWTPPLLSLC